MWKTTRSQIINNKGDYVNKLSEERKEGKQTQVNADNKDNAQDLLQ